MRRALEADEPWPMNTNQPTLACEPRRQWKAIKLSSLCVTVEGRPGWLIDNKSLGRHPYDLAVLPLDHRESETLVGDNRVVDGLAHGTFDGQRFCVQSGERTVVGRNSGHGRSPACMMVCQSDSL